jgi:nucleoside-diphosphate-sugar epimerase
LVIGGSGFVGRHIVEMLLARGETQVAVFDIVQRHFDTYVPTFLLCDPRGRGEQGERKFPGDRCVEPVPLKEGWFSFLRMILNAFADGILAYGLYRNVSFYIGDITKAQEVGDALKKVRRSPSLSRLVLSLGWLSGV